MTDADRIVALEERVAHAERAHEELSEIVRRQQATIGRLVEAVRRLEETEQGGVIDRPPPHY